METVFDYGITQSEINEIFGSHFDKDMYLKTLTQDWSYSHIYELFMVRNDQAGGRPFLDKIIDKKLALETALQH